MLLILALGVVGSQCRFQLGGLLGIRIRGNLHGLNTQHMDECTKQHQLSDIQAYAYPLMVLQIHQFGFEGGLLSNCEVVKNGNKKKLLVKPKTETTGWKRLL